MAHEHSHGDAEGTYFTDQILTVIITALLGCVALRMARPEMLRRILVPEFGWMVQAGGIALIVLAVIRAIAVWRLAGERGTVAEAEENAHGDHGHEDCGHDHAHSHSHSHSHAHSHGDEHAHVEEKAEPEVHDHGWAPWKYAILIVPAILYSLDLPNESYSEDRLKNEMNNSKLVNQRGLLAQVVGSPALLVLKNTGRINKKFSDLADAAISPEKRQAWEGKTIVLSGQFSPLTDREFTLFRVKQNCCAADQVVLNARIISPETLQNLKFNDWIQIEGELDFMKEEGKSDWVPVIRLQSISDIKRIEPDYDNRSA